jgi:hypothetical protein
MLLPSQAAPSNGSLSSFPPPPLQVPNSPTTFSRRQQRSDQLAIVPAAPSRRFLPLPTNPRLVLDTRTNRTHSHDPTPSPTSIRRRRNRDLDRFREVTRSRSICREEEGGRRRRHLLGGPEEVEDRSEEAATRSTSLVQGPTLTPRRHKSTLLFNPRSTFTRKTVTPPPMTFVVTRITKERRTTSAIAIASRRLNECSSRPRRGRCLVDRRR